MDDEAQALIAKAGFHRPTPLQIVVVPHLLAHRDVVVEAGEGTGKTVAFLTPLLVGGRQRGGGTTAVILAPGADGVRTIQRQLKNLTRNATSRCEFVAIGIEEGVRKEARLLEARPDVILASPRSLIDHIRQANVNLTAVRYVAVEAPTKDDEFLRDVEFILSKCAPQCQTALFLPSLEGYNAPRARGRAPTIVRAQDWRDAGEPVNLVEERGKGPRGRGQRTSAAPVNQGRDRSMEHIPAGAGGPQSQEAIVQAIRAHAQRVAAAPDRESLGRLARLVRRAVPLGSRTVFAAYLLREAGLATPPEREHAPPRPAARAAATPAPRAGGEPVRLFINAGRNRRVFPDDIYELFTTHLKIQRSEIGEVKVLDNYSFVEIQSAHAARAVSMLKGVELKGRKLAVDYARPRTEKKRGA